MLGISDISPGISAIFVIVQEVICIFSLCNDSNNLSSEKIFIGLKFFKIQKKKRLCPESPKSQKKYYGRLACHKVQF